MAVLNDLVVSGASSLVGPVKANTIQLDSLKIPTTSNGTTYGTGTDGQILKTNGTTVYWGNQTNTYVHPSHTAYSSGLYKITVNNLGHVTAATAVTKGDITALGIPGQDTTAATTVAVTNTTPTSATTYYPLYATGNSGQQTVRANADLYYYDTGTSSYFNVGSSSNLGGITLHQTNGYYANIIPTSLTANRDNYLPDVGGTLLNTGNYNAYAPKLDGTGATGTWGINISGSAGSVAWANVTNKTNATTSADGLMSSTDKTKLNYTNIAYGTCSTAAATAAKVITVTGNTNWTLTAGSIITVVFSNTNTAESPTFNVNSTGAKSVYYCNAKVTDSNLNYGGYKNRPMVFMYDGTQFHFVSWGYESGNTNTQIRVYRQTTGYNSDYPILVSRTATSDIATVGSNASYEGVYAVIGQDGTYTPTVNPHTGHMKVPGGITGNASSASAFDSAKSITLTGDVTGSASSNGASGWSIATTVASVAWSKITGKPSTFTPSAHTHSYIPYNGQSNYNCNTAYDAGIYMVSNGSNCPSGSQYGSLFTIPYRQGTGNSTPDFGTQIFIPNGDDSVSPNSMFFRTALRDSWNAWKEVSVVGHTHSYLPLSGGTITGNITFASNTSTTSPVEQRIVINGVSNDTTIANAPGIGFHIPNVTWGSLKFCSDGSFKFYDNSCSSLMPIYGSKVYGAVWNDYAEYRNQETKIEPGFVAYCDNNGKLKITTNRLQKFEGVVSDTFGFAIGENEVNKTPIAVSGRVLVYTQEPREQFDSGDCVCAGPNGTVSKMTREEIIQYPDRIVGIVSEIPEYDTWGSGDVKINGRIWIKVK